VTTRAERTPETGQEGPAYFSQSTRRVWIIFRKEIGEIFRDKRTLISVVITPMLVTPGLFALLGLLINHQIAAAQTQSINVAVVGASNSHTLVVALRSVPYVSVWVLPAENVAVERLRHNYLQAVVVLPPDTEKRLNSGETAQIQLLHDAGSQISLGAANRIEAFLTQFAQSLVMRRLQARGLPAQYATPLDIRNKAVQAGGGEALLMLSMLLPYMLVISVFAGAIYAAFDQVAGEKERGTLETLLVSPASRQDIVLGKFSAVVGVCMVSSILTICGLCICFFSHIRAFDWMARGGVHISFGAMFVILLALLPLSVLCAGLLLAVSTFARNQKEAQTYLAPLFIVVFLPAMASMLLGTDVSRPVALVPVLNASIIIKLALSGTYNFSFIVLAFTASAAYACIAIAFATRLFQSESVLIKA
jgi:sodium transport system permease protein